MSVYDLLRPALFQFDPESTHRFVMGAADLVLGSPLGGLTRPLFTVDDTRLRTKLFGLEFANPVGLAAGFDKNAEHVRALQRFGFGHVEIGTVTAEAQSGNPRPRLFRLPDDRGLLNRMGFNNQGSQKVEARLARLKHDTVLGVNIGKTKVVPNDDAVQDYEKSFKRLWPFADYFVVNVSSPNTPGLRELQSKEPLTALLSRLQEVNQDLSDHGHPAKPLLVKIAPDLSNGEIDDVLSVIEQCGLDGIVAANTTISRDALRTRGISDLGSGGVSGAPVRAKSLEVVRYIHQHSPKLPIVGVGGVFDHNDALAMLTAGASLVQVWTGLIYKGPTVVREINRGLVRECVRNGWNNIAQCREETP